MSQEPTVMMLQSNNFQELEDSVPARIEDILDRPIIAMICKAIGYRKLEAFLSIQLTKLASRINIDPRLSLQTHQLNFIAHELILNYPTESLEDFVLCFKRGSMGFYGQIFRIDYAVLNDWMVKYLQEKYALIEAEIKSQKGDEEKKVDYEATQQLWEARKKLIDQRKIQEITEKQSEANYQLYKLNQQKVDETVMNYYKDSNTEVYSFMIEGFRVHARTQQEANEIFEEAKLYFK